MSQLQFIPLPDPRFPETLTPENIAMLQAWGVIPQGVSAYASRTHWGSTPGTHGLFPEEGTTPKYWTDRQPDAGGGYLFRVGETKVFRSNTEAKPADIFPSLRALKFTNDEAISDDIDSDEDLAASSFQQLRRGLRA